MVNNTKQKRGGVLQSVQKAACVYNWSYIVGCLPPISVCHFYGLAILSSTSINMQDHEGKAEETYT